MSYTLIAIIAGAVVLFTLLMVFLARYKRCSADEILVISGKTGKNKDGGNRSAKIIKGGATFVMPIFQEYRKLSLNPYKISINLEDALSSQNIRVNVPSNFTISISSAPGTAENAAEKLLSLNDNQIIDLAQDIIVGQMRAVIAGLTIEEINRDRQKFQEEIGKNIEGELTKIGMELINVNITDITDESDYISSLGQEAAAEVKNKARKSVAEKTRDGSIGEAEAQKDERVKVASLHAESEIGEKNAEAERREKVASANAKAIDGENSAKISIAQSDSKRAVQESEALKESTIAQNVNSAKSKQQSYDAERIAEDKRAEKEKATQYANVVVPAEIEKDRTAIEAEGEAEHTRRIAKGQADAIREKAIAEADGAEAMLQAMANGLEKIVKAAGGDADKAMGLMLVDKLPEIVKLQSEAIQNIDFEKVVVWDNGGNGQGGSSTGNFLNNLITGTLPMSDEIYEMIGKKLPGIIDVRDNDSEKAEDVKLIQESSNQEDENSEE
jgi:flotillin